MQIRPYTSADEDAVVALWERCELTRPWNDAGKDIQRKLAVRPDLFLVAERNDAIVGTVMAGYDGHRGWINYLGVEPSCRRQGIARSLMAEAAQRLLACGCPKINLQVRCGNTAAIEFYQSIGFAIDNVVSLGKRLVVEAPE